MKKAFLGILVVPLLTLLLSPAAQSNSLPEPPGFEPTSSVDKEIFHPSIASSRTHRSVHSHEVQNDSINPSNRTLITVNSAQSIQTEPALQRARRNSREDRKKGTDRGRSSKKDKGEEENKDGDADDEEENQDEGDEDENDDADDDEEESDGQEENDGKSNKKNDEKNKKDDKDKNKGKDGDKGNKGQDQENNKNNKESNDKEESITICHSPPENPDQKRTIKVGKDSLETHLDHGDSRGPCSEE